MGEKKEETLLLSAVDYVESGLAVIPLVPEKKNPLVKNWTNCWTKDPDQVRTWWKQWPKANIGIVCGEPSGLVVLDVDGPMGRDALQGKSLPPTVTVLTGQDGGIHYWYRYDPDELDIGKWNHLLEKVDLIADGGLAVAPPSVHPSGDNYRFHDLLDPEATRPAELPGWLRRELDPEPQSPTTSNQQGEPLPTDEQKDFDEIIEETLEPTDGQVISPLFMKSAPKYGELDPLEAPDRHSGQRNTWLFEKCLTHLNLGLPYDQFRAIFYRRVWPDMDKGPGADGEPFTAAEANRTIKSARRVAKQCGPLPSNIIRYHTYRTSSEDEESNSTNKNTRGPTLWSTGGLKRACIGFLSQKGELEYHSGADGKPCLSLLVTDLQDWIQEKWPHKERVPRRSLCRVLKELDRSGLLEKDVRRQGTGHVVMTLAIRSEKEASVPTLRSNRGGNPETEKTTARGRAKTEKNKRSPGKARASPEKLNKKRPKNLKKLLERGSSVPTYPYVDQLIKNSGMTLRPPERKTCHTIAWLTEDPNFATWVLRQYRMVIIGPVLKQLYMHFEDVRDVGAWMRTRLRREEASSSYGD